MPNEDYASDQSNHTWGPPRDSLLELGLSAFAEAFGALPQDAKLLLSSCRTHSHTYNAMAADVFSWADGKQGRFRDVIQGVQLPSRKESKTRVTSKALSSLVWCFFYLCEARRKNRIFHTDFAHLEGKFRRQFYRQGRESREFYDTHIAGPCGTLCSRHTPDAEVHIHVLDTLARQMALLTAFLTDLLLDSGLVSRSRLDREFSKRKCNLGRRQFEWATKPSVREAATAYNRLIREETTPGASTIKTELPIDIPREWNEAGEEWRRRALNTVRRCFEEIVTALSRLCPRSIATEGESDRTEEARGHSRSVEARKQPLGWRKGVEQDPEVERTGSGPSGKQKVNPKTTPESVENAARQLNGVYSRYTARFITQSPLMLPVFEVLDKALDRDEPLLINGETGTGKGLLAEIVHNLGPRRDARFLCIICSAIQDTLLEETSFGHRAGAFTGASADSCGYFEAAGNGTVFLDEIGDASPSMQAKLLRVIEDGAYSRIGDTSPRRSHARVTAATHKNLSEAVSLGKFRGDLLHRLTVLRVLIPPLRERPEDIPLLAEHFLGALSPGKKLSMEAITALVDYGWPGNVRELRSAVTRAALLSETEVVTEEHIHRALMMSCDPEPNTTTQTGKGLHLAKEGAIYEAVLRKSKGNMSEACKLLPTEYSCAYSTFARRASDIHGITRAMRRQMRNAV